MGEDVKKLLAMLSVVSLGWAIVPASAETSFEQCRAVRQAAHIKYDNLLIVNVYENSDVQACYFTVNLEPPADTDPQNPSTAAAKALSKVALASTDAINAEAESATAALIDGLLAPLADDNSELASRLRTEVRETETGTIGTCIVDIFRDALKFTRRSEIISCGLTETGSIVFQAELEALRVALVLPRRNRG